MNEADVWDPVVFFNCEKAALRTASYDYKLRCEILRGQLIIGDVIGAEDITTADPRIKSVVSVHARQRGQKGCYYKTEDGITYHHLVADDNWEEERMLGQLDAATAFMRERIKVHHECVYVHCEAGISRSATVCIAYLMRYHRMSMEQAYVVVYVARPVIEPNPAFKRQLKMYEEQLIVREKAKAETIKRCKKSIDAAMEAGFDPIVVLPATEKAAIKNKEEEWV